MRWSTLILAIVCLLSFYFLFELKKELQHHYQSNNSAADRIIHNPSYQTFSNSGGITKTLHAQLSTHFKQNNTTHYEALSGDVFQKNHWHIKSDHAFSEQGNENIILYDHVILHQLAKKNGDDTKILTSWLKYNQTTQIATSPKPVTIIKPNSVTKGVGLKVNFKTGVYKILQHVGVDYNL